MDLTQIKVKLEEKRQKKNNLLGQQEVLMKRLAEEGFSTIEEVEKAIVTLTKKISKLEESKQQKIEIFTTKYKDLLK